MKISGISFGIEVNHPAVTIGKYTVVFNKYYWFNTKKTLTIRRFLGMWIIKED